MNRIAAFALVATSIVAPTLAHAESGAPATQERRIIEAPAKDSWIRILPAPATTSPLLFPAVPSMSQGFGVRIDGEAIAPAPAATAPRLMTDIPGIPLVVFKF
jgi:hypothetical protein